jgi:hypothetical protein
MTFRNKGFFLSTHELFITPWVVEKLQEGFEKPREVLWNLCELKELCVRLLKPQNKMKKPPKRGFPKKLIFYKIDLNFMSGFSIYNNSYNDIKKSLYSI